MEKLMNRQEELEGMSDRAINRLIAGSNYYCASYDSDSEIVIDEGMAWVDYCNNPNDIMPIAIENGISLLLDESDLPEATTNPSASLVSGWGEDCISSLDMNIYRAICIVFILMKEVENETK
jgi:hypothetical protein